MYNRFSRFSKYNNYSNMHSNLYIIFMTYNSITILVLKNVKILNDYQIPKIKIKIKNE